MLEVLMMAAIVVIVPAVFLGLVRFFRANAHLVVRPLSARGLEKTWYVAAAILGLLVLVVMLNADHGPRGEMNVMAVLALLVLGAFFYVWRREFVFLMSLRDDDFPGRFDKPIWAAVLVALAPIGFWLFRSYRLAHWPEPKPEMAGGDVAAELS